MNFKKFLTLGLVLLGSAALAFGEITLKDLGGGQVQITFLYKDASSEMGVIGSFDNWTTPGEAMTKNDAGLWEKTITAAATDEIVYKFYSKGSWIFDDQAPDKKDDGFGGFNGLIVVQDILSGVTPVKPGAKAVAVKGPKGPPGRPKVAFGTETYLIADSTFRTEGSQPSLKDSAVNAKSVWKFEGDLVPRFPGHLELTTFQARTTVYDPSGTTLNDGLNNLAAGLIFNPYYYLGGNKRPQLDKLRFGIDAPWLIWETGYANSVLPTRTSVLWTTVNDETKAADGYSLFRSGPDARTFGDLTLDVGLVPNKSLDGYYGLIGWLTAEAWGAKLDVQVDQKASTKTDPALWFKNPTREDLVVGAEYYAEELFLQGQFLTSAYVKGGSIDALPAADKLALKAVLGYRDVYQTSEVKLSYALRGSAAQLLYGSSDDELGTVKTQTGGLEAWTKFDYWGVAKLKATGTFAYRSTDSDVKTVVRPGFLLNLDPLNIAPVSLETFAEAVHHTSPAAGSAALSLGSGGLEARGKNWTADYQFDGASSRGFHTLLGRADLGSGWNLQAGAAYRTSGTSPYGGLVGVSYVVPVPEAKTPTVFVQALANLDPYDADAKTSFDLTDFGPTSGVAGSEGLGALRLGVAWSY